VLSLPGGSLSLDNGGSVALAERSTAVYCCRMAASESPLTKAFDVETFAAAVPTAPEVLSRSFDGADVVDVRHAVRDHAEAAGMTGDELFDFVLAVQELITNAVRHGGGRGELRLRRDGDTLICDVTDHGNGFADGLPVTTGPPPVDDTGGRGLWLARQFSDTLMVSDGPDGVTVSVTACLAASAPAPVALAEMAQVDRPT
jgi:anti-sigma regulatory factor (Ser/Thr protein kinase)